MPVRIWDIQSLSNTPVRQNIVELYMRPTDQTTLQIATLEGHVGNVVALAYSALGKWIVTGSEDGTVKVWDTRYGHSDPLPHMVI